MPWNEVLLPPLAGTLRALSLDHREIAVWTEHGLFRYEVEAYPCLRRLLPAGLAEERFDTATGQVRWLKYTYQTVGDPAWAPAATAEQLESDGPDGQSLRAERGRVRVVGPGGDARLTVDGLAAGWRVATFVGHDGLLVAGAAGVRLFKYSEPPPVVHARWQGGVRGDDHASLLTVVLASPDDDAPRLVYADWLEENGDPERAELIRLQCGLARRMGEAPVPRDDPDAGRAWDLVNENRDRWVADMPQVRGVDWRRYGTAGFWRGFPQVRVGSPVTLVRSARRLGEATPVEYAVVSDLLVSNVAALAGSPVFEWLRVVDIEYNGMRAAEALEPLLGSPRAGGLRGLRVRSLPGPAARALADNPHLSALRWLDLGDAELSDAAVRALASAAQLPAVRWVRLTNGRVTDAARRRLAERFAVVTV